MENLFKRFYEVYGLKGMAMYALMIITLICNFHQLSQKGYEPMGKLIQSCLPTFPTTMKESTMGDYYLYQFTHVLIGRPLSFIIGAMPYLETYEPFTTLATELEGEFEKEQKVEQQPIKTPQVVEEKSTTINLNQFKDYYYVLKNFVTGDGSLQVDLDLLKQWNYYDLIERDLHIEKEKGPQVLIFHTHARETYIGGTSVVDVGEELKKDLEAQGISVLHVTDEFYAADNPSNYPDGTEYERIEEPIRQVLAENPSISVVIDLHRDGVSEGTHLVTDVNGKPTAEVMFVNGLCEHRNLKGEIVQKTGLPNPYLEDNMALALQAQVKAYEYYPGLMRKIYYKEYRYSLHMKPRSLLIEVGADTNTGEEALNAAAPLADILAKVLQKD